MHGMPGTDEGRHRWGYTYKCLNMKLEELLSLGEG